MLFRSTVEHTIDAICDRPPTSPLILELPCKGKNNNKKMVQYRRRQEHPNNNSPSDGPKSRQSPRNKRHRQIRSAQCDEFTVRTDHVSESGCVLFGGDDGVEETDYRDQTVKGKREYDRYIWTSGVVCEALTWQLTW